MSWFRRRREGEHRRPDVGDVLVEPVVRPQPRLQLHEVRRIVHVRDEHEAGVQLPELIDAVGVVVGAAQDLDAAVVLVGGQRDVRVLRDDVLAVRRLGEVRRVELLGPGQRRALGFAAAEDGLLVADAIGIPDLDVHLDLAGDLVAAAGHPSCVVAEPDEVPVLVV